MQVALRKLGVGSSVKEGPKMLRVNVPLDPTRTGREAEALEVSLGRLIIGQDEAIQQIVNIYQMYLTGMTPSGPPDRKLPVPWTHWIWQDPHRRSYR